MKYAIIAAGEGSRLAQEGITSPKPLVEVNGERLIDRLLRVFMANGASEVVVICNEQMTAVRNHLETISQRGDIRRSLLLMLRLSRDSSRVARLTD